MGAASRRGRRCREKRTQKLLGNFPLRRRSVRPTRSEPPSAFVKASDKYLCSRPDALVQVQRQFGNVLP